jgi:glycosyltransferase involved in cell wall biosynthesis
MGSGDGKGKKMDIFSNEKTIISDVINRVLNCREIKELYVFGECGDELANLYPAIHVNKGSRQKNVTEDAVYIQIADVNKLRQIIPWIAEEKATKDFFIYVSAGVEISDEEKQVLGKSNYLKRYSGLSGTLFLTGISFEGPGKLLVPENFKVLAILHFYNEADILGQTIQYLLSQEIDLYLLDNWSDDGSFEIARRYQESYPERIYLEQFPLSGGSSDYEWYKQLEKTETISKTLDYDWFIHYDADEMRVSPWENTTLREAIYWIDRQAYNCIENTVIDFRVTSQNMNNIFMQDTFFDFRHLEIMFDQLKTWKKSQQIELKLSAGHFAHVANPKIYPLKFLNRHYPMRSIEQAKKKVFQDRLPRFQKEHGERGWHVHYNEFKKTEDFIFDSSQLLNWQKDTFRELYIPFFLECGLRWDRNNHLTKIELKDIKNLKVVVYGAGNIGKRTYLRLAERNHIVAWVDKQYEQQPAMFCEKIVSPQEIANMEYDYIVVAVKKAELVREIKEELMNTHGVQEEKIMCVKT